MVGAPASIVKQPDTLASLPQTEIDFQIKADARYILAKADSMVPRQFTSDSWPNYSQPSCDFRYKYRFLRSDLSISCLDNKIGVRLTGNYQISGGRCLCTMDKPVSPWVSGSCGYGNEPMRRVNIHIGSQLSFLSNYHIITTTSTDRLEALDRCSVSLFSSDVTQQVLDSIRSSLASFCSSLDETIAGIDFRTMLQPVIEKSYDRTAISKYGYIAINPSSIRVGKLNYSKDTFSISVGLSCRPELSSDSSHLKAPAQLPVLQATENRNGVSLYLNAVYGYDFLSRILNDTLHNKVFVIQGRTIVIKEVSMKGLGNHRVEIKIEFSGSNKGKVYLQGTPELDTAKQTLTIPDISYTLESGDLILNIAKSLFKNKIRKTLNGNSYLDLAAFFKSNIPLIEKNLNRKLTNSIQLSGKINQLRLIGLLTKKEEIQVQLYTNAVISMANSENLK
jgi:hypothetical protein